MKITTFLAAGTLILFGVFAAVYALFGVNVLLLVCAKNFIVYRAVLSLAGIAALWLLYWLIAFRPTKYIS